jgi:aspartyl-tRNA(Asn)/glutamyl-tRNA(Gln) amidotransferase subunit B
MSALLDVSKVLEIYEPVIGLEVHAQLLTRSKIFCGCATKYGAPPNTQVCPICLGHPGVLPVMNARAVEMAIKVGLAIGAVVHRRSVFARKNYFYPDLPKNYQISQYDRPILTGGAIEIDLPTGGTKRIGLTRIHLEEDAGKSIHPPGRADASLVDLNRCGVPLIEIVSEPDLRSPAEAYTYLIALKQLLLYLEVNDGNMEEGSLRCDANVSLRKRGTETLGTKTETKNLNSFRNVERALAHEIARQGSLLESGKRVSQETLLWDADRAISVPMRSKEEAHDYRYFPEPDLLPLVVTDDILARAGVSLPELPRAKRERLAREYSIPDYDAEVLAGSMDLADYFERVAKAAGDGKLASNWVMTEILRLLKEGSGRVADLPVSAEHLGELVGMIRSGEISGKIAKTIFEEMLASATASGEAPFSGEAHPSGDRADLPPPKEVVAARKTPRMILEEKGLTKISDLEEIRRIAGLVISKNAGPVAEFLRGKEGTFTFLVGQAMKESRGRAEPELLRKTLREELDRLR